MYEYIIETGTPLSELKTFPNYKETLAFSKTTMQTEITGVGPCFVYAAILKFQVHPPVVKITWYG